VTRFLDVRLAPVGGDLATRVALTELTEAGVYQTVGTSQFVDDLRGRHVLITAHGFNVNRHDGVASLSNWSRLLKLPEPSAFVGLLWPGDSMWMYGLDYPEEPRIANAAGQLIGPFVDANFTGAASVSFASHSLGARVVLATIAHMQMPVRRLVLMAGAVDDDCLTGEFKTAAGSVREISVLASHRDAVLAAAFPLGDFLAGLVAKGHPWYRGALGRFGPASPRPGNFRAPFEIPDAWRYGHHNYLDIDPPPAPNIAPPVDVPPSRAPEPAGGATGWQEAWSAAFVSTRFQ
jgi:hypothetical protein